MGKRWNIIMPIVVVAVVAVIVFIKRDDLGAFVETVQNVAVVPFALAAACLFGRYFSHAFAYKAVFHCVDEDVKYLHIVPLVFSVTFANDCAPTAGTAGSVLIAAWSHKQGLDMGKSVTVVFLEKIGFYGGFAIVMLIGFGILIFTGQMVWYLALGGLAVLLMIFFFGFVMWLGYSHVATEQKLFTWVQNLVNRALVIFKRKPLDPWATRIAASFHEAASIAVEKPLQLVNMFARMTLLHACDCLCFIFVGYAFGYDYIPFLIASYVAGFIIATFILQTIGAVEILLGLILTAYGATPAEAAAIALAYRGLIFWVPFIIGAICINITGAQKQVFAKGSGELLAKGGDENVEAAHLEAKQDSPEEYEDMSAMLPVPPASWTREQDKKKHEFIKVHLADVIESFQVGSAIEFTVTEPDNAAEEDSGQASKDTQYDQDDESPAQSAFEEALQEGLETPQSSSMTAVGEVVSVDSAVQETETGEIITDIEIESDQEA